MSKLDGNGLFESSRFMLPQHIEAVRQLEKMERLKVKPVIHDDEWEVFMQFIHQSKGMKENVVITLYGDFEDDDYVGVVTKVDRYRKVLRIETEEDYTWLKLEDVVGVRME